MKTEIVNFINDLPQEVHSYNLKLDEGLYVFVHLDEDGKLLSSEKEFIEENSIKKEFYNTCLHRVTNSKMLTSNKRYNQSFEIGSPFGIGFKKDILFGNEKKENKGYNNQRIIEKIESYFDVAENFIDKEEAIHNKWLNAFKIFCQNQLIPYSKQLFDEFKKAKVIYIFLQEVQDIAFENSHKKYLSERGVFNDPKSAITFNGKKYQVSDTLNGFGIKKIFLEHKTAPFNLNMLIDEYDAVSIWKFFELVSNNALTNPCPIFIDKEELPDGEKIGAKLNKEIIRLVNDDPDNKLSFSKIIKRLYENSAYNRYLSNYYLFFFQVIPKKGYKVIDIDFIPVFRYEINDIQIFEVFHNSKKQEIQIENIFDFESKIANHIFNRQLVIETKAGGLWMKYFGDIDFDPTYMTHNTYNQLLKYRKAFYDYIYKSKREAIQSFMFYDIMLNGILDDIRYHQFEPKDKYYTTEEDIKKKLNIWFSLYYYFDLNNSKSDFNMINKTELLRKRINEIAKKEGNKPFIETEEEFAFASGQVIYWLLLQSESANRTHAMLEPFLQKTDVKLFKESIGRTFELYKHKFTIYPDKYEFDRILSQVMGCETEINLKTLLPLILAGYFSDSVFKKSESNS
ncbi:MAG: hypothetical protein JW973_04420 [Bacteroidales bacterium]|nr:hypothetical protein [Bacteroidales bacterium]